jgi:hypothetical protein
MFCVWSVLYCRVTGMLARDNLLFKVCMSGAERKELKFHSNLVSFANDLARPHPSFPQSGTEGLALSPGPPPIKAGFGLAGRRG